MRQLITTKKQWVLGALFLSGTLFAANDKTAEAENQPFDTYRDFTAYTFSGEVIRLSDVVAENRYTMVEFWAG